MIATAGKYTDVRQAAHTGERPAFAGRTGSRRPVTGAPAIVSPNRKKLINMREWFWKELRDGRILNKYLSRERARVDHDIRNVARKVHGTRPNSRSDMELLATIPARLFHRWRQEDPDFWKDDANLKRLKRDNPDLPVYIR